MKAASRQPLRRSARNSKVAIAERKNRIKKTVNRTVTFTESTIVTIGNTQKEERTEVVFVSPPIVEELLPPATLLNRKKKNKKEIQE
jgi:hypothetical protein